MTIELAGRADIPAIALLIATAFHDLAPSRWLVPDPVERRAIFPAWFTTYVEEAMAEGYVETNQDRTAAALWMRKVPPAADEHAAQLEAITGDHVDTFRAFEAILDAHHPRTPPHDWLAIMAVHPTMWGCGLGGELLKHHHERLDRVGIPAYLEAADDDSRLFYIRHGYTDLGKPIRLPNGPIMFPMWRPPLGHEVH